MGNVGSTVAKPARKWDLKSSMEEILVEHIIRSDDFTFGTIFDWFCKDSIAITILHYKNVLVAFEGTTGNRPVKSMKILPVPGW
eukprot:9345001-Ditylum_brightwellii.AAC.1